MKVLISWSGDRSRAVAEALVPWLRNTIGCEPWLSTQNIYGGQWTPQLQRGIAGCEAAIACLTPENLSSEWMHFECGAVAARVESSLIIPWCIDVPAGTIRLPLSQYQVYEATRAGTKQMLLSLRRYQEPLGQYHPLDIEGLMDEHFPELDSRLAEIRVSFGAGISTQYSIQSQPGLKYEDIIDSQTRELYIVGQNLQGPIRSGFFDRLRDYFIERPGFKTLIILAPYEYFHFLTSSSEQRQIYSEQYRSTIEHLKALRDSIGEVARERLRVYSHAGACSLSAIFCDPNDVKRARLAFTAKWATDESPDNRISCVVRRLDNERLFSALHGYIGIMNDKTHSRTFDQLLTLLSDHSNISSRVNASS